MQKDHQSRLQNRQIRRKISHLQKVQFNYCWHRQRHFRPRQKEIIMLKDTINTTIKQNLIDKIGKKRNIFSLPHLSKVVINYRVGEARESQESLASATEEIIAITGQKPQLCKAKKAVSAFKLRQNDPLALKVTLRGARMYDFVEKLFNLILPRLRDFKGMSATAFDSVGNYNLTIKDQTLFPEINLDKVNKIRSVQITLNIKAASKDEAKMLLSALGFPFEKSADSELQK